MCLAISHTGATRGTVDTTRRAREAGATVVALTQTLMARRATAAQRALGLSADVTADHAYQPQAPRFRWTLAR
ncbi:MULTISPECIES: hypothetical protein [unclassified Streptomyces]|uniref:hypothetical protein n=1 Tax=Streptomyces sp. NPDC055082 TaxID=3365718 RepID=UPI0037D46BD9